MSDEIVKSRSGWILKVSPERTLKAGKLQVSYRVIQLTLKDVRGNHSVHEEYTFRALERDLSKILETSTWRLTEVQELHSEYQRSLSSAGQYSFDDNGLSGSLSAEGVRMELRLPSKEEVLQYWQGVSPTVPISGTMFGGSDTVVATIHTEHESTVVLLNIFYLRHWSEYHFHKLKAGKVEEHMTDYVLAYKKRGKWLQGKAPFAENIDCLVMSL